MVSPNVSKFLEEAKTLTPDERRQLRSLLDEPAAAQPGLSKEEHLARVLLDRGIITRIRPKPTEADIARFNAWKPVPIKGKPLSETIIEERR
jgi:hypothetical protein